MAKKIKKHKFKVGDILVVTIFDIKRYTKVLSLERMGANDQPAYTLSGYGDKVVESNIMRKSSSKIAAKFFSNTKNRHYAMNEKFQPER